MAFADECPLVGLNYIRAAAQNLALAEVPTSAGAASFRAAAVPEKPLDSARLLPAEAPAGPSIFGKPLNEPPMVPTFAHYGPSKANSSFLRRLAEKFGVSS
jgi:hypothetical protein